jgi:hypothetical protein
VTEQSHRRGLDDAIRAALSERAARERYWRSQRQARRRTADGVGRARPLVFDESGFPIRRRSGGFAARVARMLPLE